jgi:hypothetical protein
MKLLRSLVLVFCISIPFVSCIDIIEDMILNKDGSGKYSITIDMGSLMNDPLLKSMMEGEDSKKMEDMDSTVYFKDLPDSLIKDNPDLWKRVTMRIFSNAKEEAFFLKVNFDFKNVEEIAYLSANLNKVMDASKANPLASDQASAGGSSGLLDDGLGYMLKGKELIRKTKEKATEETSEDIEMLKTFMGDATYKLNFEMPGRVTKVTIPNAKVDGKKVTVVTPFLEILEKNTRMDGIVKYK